MTPSEQKAAAASGVLRDAGSAEDCPGALSLAHLSGEEPAQGHVHYWQACVHMHMWGDTCVYARLYASVGSRLVMCILHNTLVPSIFVEPPTRLPPCLWPRPGGWPALKPTTTALLFLLTCAACTTCAGVEHQPCTSSSSVSGAHVTVSGAAHSGAEYTPYSVQECPCAVVAGGLGVCNHVVRTKVYCPCV